MSKEFDKWYDSRSCLDDYNYELAKEAWNAARNKILEILKENQNKEYLEEFGIRDLEYKNIPVIKKIENL